MRRRYAKQPEPTPTDDAPEPLHELAPLLDRLAEDSWTLAQRHPALPAPQSLIAEAERLLGVARRLLRRAPGHRLLPLHLPPALAGARLTLSALALALRQAQAALAPLVARHTPPPPRTVADEIDDITRLQALLVRRFTTDYAERNDVALPEELRPAPAPPPPPPAPGRPPAPMPHIRQTRMRRASRRRRARRTPQAGPAPVATTAETPDHPPMPRIR